ncbi:MAG TPA: UDP-N-acetylmuramoyl-L-alanine--D-glutamate ligase [Actinomycetota bacterium]
MNLRGRRVLVVGLGHSGLAAAEALRERGAKVTVSEARPAEDLGEAAAAADGLGATVRAGGHHPSHLNGAELVVVSPGVPEGAPILTEAAARGVEVWSELELGARLATCPYVAITGTNGKTTTTELVAAAMREAGRDAVACGNVGHPFSRAAREGRQALVVEASSFQLRFHRTFHPRVSALLNLAPDHLDWHPSMEAYAAAKARIFEQQGGSDVHAGNAADSAARRVSERAPCAVAWFTDGPPGPDHAAGFEDDRLVVRWHGARHDLGPPVDRSGTFRANASAAALCAMAFGVDPGAVQRALAAHVVGEHRGRVVAEVAGVRFVDDSKATNPHAAVASISGHERVVLIAGGLSKGVDLGPLRSVADRLAAVVAIGRAAEEIASLFEGVVPVRRARTMEAAVEEAAGLAGAGTDVLLAPACASMDMFRDYRERGERFAAAAREMERRAAHA